MRHGAEGRVFTVSARMLIEIILVTLAMAATAEFAHRLVQSAGIPYVDVREFEEKPEHRDGRG